ncbi:MAG: M16 family metallopeptidase [Thermoguttaceae bacterium]
MFQHTTLDNGLTILTESRDTAYTCAVGFFVECGSRDENDTVSGVSHLLEHLVFKGSEKRTAEEVNRHFDEIGANSNAYTSEEQTVYYGTVLPELQENLIELLADILRPAIRDKDFETEKLVVLEEIEMYNDQPPFGADEKCRAIFYAGHPLENSILGSLESIKNLSREQTQEYFYRKYSPENITLVCCGKVDFNETVAIAEKYCGKWKPTGKNIRNLHRVTGKKNSCAIPKDSAKFQYTMQLVDGPCATDSDRFAAELLICVIGDDVGSRLYWDLVDPGLVESVGLSHYEYHDNGFFLTGMCCAPEKSAENLHRIAEIYQATLEKGISEDELTRAKNKTLARIVLGNERPRGRLFSVGDEWTVRKQYRTVRENLDAVNAVTLQDLHDVLERYPLTDPLSIIVGKIH